MTRSHRPSPMAATIALAGVVCAAGAAALAGLPAARWSHRPARRGRSRRAFVPGEILVRFARRAPARGRAPQQRRRSRDLARAASEPPREVGGAQLHRPGFGPGVDPERPGRARGPPGGWQQLQWNFLPCGSECGDNPDSTPEAFGGIDAPGAWRNLIGAGRPGGRASRSRWSTPASRTADRGERFREAPTSSAASSRPATTSSTTTRSRSTRTATARTWPRRSASAPTTGGSSPAWPTARS